MEGVAELLDEGLGREGVAESETVVRVKKLCVIVWLSEDVQEADRLGVLDRGDMLQDDDVVWLRVSEGLALS